MRLQEYIVPVVRYDAGVLRAVLGTGFIVEFRDMRLVMTAGHVLDAARDNGWEFGVLYLLTSGELHFASASSYVRSKRHDIAAIPLNDFAEGLPAGGLHFGSPDYPLDADLCTFEYSRSSLFSIPGEEHPALAVLPYFHKGHAMRRYFEPPSDLNGESRLELSFPALQGASGAPVLNTGGDNGVVGMVVANHEQHLMPAQVVRVECGGDATEEVSYFLPMAVALDVRAILDFLEGEDPAECIVDLAQRQATTEPPEAAG